MKITKFGHCCLLIEEGDLRILTDPGNYTTEQNDVKNIDVVLITHEHQDHLHVDSLKAVLTNNPQVRIFTNQGVGKILDKERIQYELLEEGGKISFKELTIEGFGQYHAEMYQTIQPVANTGYFIANKFFYPGDALTIPPKPVSILALPVAGPWLKLSEAIDYAIKVRPEKCFPVHDGILKSIGSTNRIPVQVLPPLGIEFIIPEFGKEIIF